MKIEGDTTALYKYFLQSLESIPNRFAVYYQAMSPIDSETCNSHHRHIIIAGSGCERVLGSNVNDLTALVSALGWRNDASAMCEWAALKDA